MNMHAVSAPAVTMISCAETTDSRYPCGAGADLLYDPLGDRYIIEKIIQLQAAAAGSNRASAPEARERGDYARAVITELLQMREEWRHANCPGN